MVDGLNLLERITWGIVIAWALIYSGYLVIGALQEFEANPTLTTYESTEISEVPFPAVTVDAGSIFNHWGFVRAHLDSLEPNYKQPLNRRFAPLKRRIFEVIYPDLREHVYSVLVNQTSIMDVRNASMFFSERFGDFGEYLNVEDINNEPILAEFYTPQYQEFFHLRMNLRLHPDYGEGLLLLRLSALMMEHPMDANMIMNTLETMAGEAFQLGMGWNYELQQTFAYLFDNVWEILQENMAKTGRFPSEASLDACYNGEDACLDALNDVGSRILSITILRFHGSTSTPFGLFLERYFMNVYNEPFMNDQTATNDLEDLVSDFLVEATHRIFKDFKHNISLYEISQIVDLPYVNFTARPYQAKEAYRDMNCLNYDYIVEYRTSSCDSLPPHPHIVGCCRIWAAIANRHEEVLKLMKFNQQPPHHRDYSTFSAQELKKGYFADLEVSDRTDYLHLYNPRVFGCQWQGQPEDLDDISRCNLFHRHFTNAGVGYTFNQANFEDMFIPSPYMKLFQKVMNPRSVLHNTSIQFLDNAGPERTLKIHVELSRNLGEYIKFANPLYTWMGGLSYSPFRSVENVFKIALHDSSSIPDLRYDYIKISPGLEYKILITPTKIESDESLRSMDIERRNCRFDDEIEDSVLFQKYSQSGCFLECQIRKAVEECDCLPWNYPHYTVNGQLTKLCDYRGHFCVEEILKRSTFWKECNCYPSCNTMTYTYSISNKPATRLCPFNTIFGTSSAYVAEGDYKAFISYPIDDQLTGKHSNRASDRLAKEYFCQNRCDNVSVVEFQVVGTSVTVIKKSARTTFISTLANLGGLVALFTGISILSLFEMVFWALRYLRAVVFIPIRKGHKSK
ncbi:uncharacterized protein LOC131885143 [Tigriopus californicus]|uniref:uncharacterized protein LOC131885143 n=1 Tax=Tigriopus californicus TaxID=6832 RepID=UPI0027D9F70E|nr:uncharacterized protein LOC131885143 [Tigriopus californicus]